MAVDAALEVAENHTEFFWLMNKQVLVRYGGRMNINMYCLQILMVKNEKPNL